MNFLKTFAAATVAALISAPAFSACTSPSDIDANSMVFQMYPNASGETYIGIAANAPDLTSEGTVYYSLDQHNMVACDGTDWVAMMGGASSSGSGQKVMVDAGSYELSVKNSYSELTQNNIVIPGFDTNLGYKVRVQYAKYGSNGHYSECYIGAMSNGVVDKMVNIDITRTQCSGTAEGGRTCTESVVSRDGTGLELEFIPNGDGTFNFGSNNIGRSGQYDFDGSVLLSYRDSYTLEEFFVPNGARVYNNSYTKASTCTASVTWEAYEYQ